MNRRRSFYSVKEQITVRVQSCTDVLMSVCCSVSHSDTYHYASSSNDEKTRSISRREDTVTNRLTNDIKQLLFSADVYVSVAYTRIDSLPKLFGATP